METFKAVLKKKVSWGDLDPLGIVFYPRYYEWIDAASQIKEIQEKTVLLNHEIRLSKKALFLPRHMKKGYVSERQKMALKPYLFLI